MLWGAHDEAVHSRHRYTRGEVRRLLEGEGLEVARLTYANTLLFPVRRRPAHARPPPAPARLRRRLPARRRWSGRSAPPRDRGASGAPPRAAHRGQRLRSGPQARYGRGRGPRLQSPACGARTHERPPAGGGGAAAGARGGARARACTSGTGRPSPAPRAVADAAAPCLRTGSRPASTPTPRPDNAALNAGWRVRDALGGGGWRRLLARGLGRVLARVLDAQESFNSRQVQFDNAILDYIDARLSATHRHYDDVLGLHGRHMGEIDERHLILQEELVAHVHDLVRRIDLVLAEAERGRLGLERDLRDVRDRARAARGAARPRDEDGPGVRRPGAVHHGRRRDPGLGAAHEPGAPRVPRGRGGVPFKWYPVSELVRQALAWRLLDVTESNGTPVDLVIPTKFPSFLVRHPRKVAWLFHQHREAYDLFGTPYCSFTRQPRGRPGARGHPRHGHGRAGGVPRRSTRSRATWPSACGSYNGLPGEPLYPPPHHLGRYRTDGLRRLPLLRRPARPPEAPRPRHRRHAARAQRRPAEDRGRGPAGGRAAQADRGARRRGPRRARWASSPPTS